MDFLKSLLEPGTVVGIVGVLIGVWGLWATHKSKRIQILEYQVTTNLLITEEMSQIPGLAISLDNQPVSNLVSSKIKFINTGSETINSKDFAAAEPLSIRVSGHFFGMQHECHISSSNPNTLLQIKRINEDLMKLDFDFLKPKQSFSITVLHDGKLLVSGELKAGKVKEYHRKIGAAEILSSFPIIGSFVLGLFFMSINGYFSLYSLMSITMSGTILSLALRQIFSLPTFRIFDNLKMMLTPLDDEE